MVDRRRLQPQKKVFNTKKMIEVGTSSKQITGIYEGVRQRSDRAVTLTAESKWIDFSMTKKGDYDNRTRT